MSGEIVRRCRACNREVPPEYQGPCPHCGANRGLDISITVSDQVLIAEGRPPILLFPGGAGSWNPERDLPPEDRQVITPEQFRSGVVAVTDPRLIQHFLDHPEDLRQIGSRTFEEFIAELLARFGYKPRIGPPGRDGGIDIYAERYQVASELLLVQCKRYAEDNKVGVGVVKQLYADVEQCHATSGLVVTTSYFTAPALDYIEAVKYRLAGRDFERLKEWLAAARIVGGGR
jgi:restriction endonuclease Mrr